jgi:hypothetical protein
MADSDDVANEEKIRTIFHAISATARSSFDQDAVLIRWVVVADWMTVDNRRALTRIAPASSTWWEDHGLLNAALRGDWGT